MKKIILFITIFLFAFSMLNAQDNYYRQFNGTSQSLYVKDDTNNDLDISNNWTIEAWVKVHSYTNGTWSVIMDRKGVFSLYLIDDANADFAVRFVARDASNDNIIASLQSDASSTNLSLDQWFHVAVKYDGSDARLYLNGNLIIEDNSDPDFNLSASSNNLNIGVRYWGGYSRYLDGSVDQVRISNTARYAGNFTPPNFYSLLGTDANTALLLNFENNKNDDSGNFASAIIYNHGAAIYIRKVGISPTDIQNISSNTDGTELTVTEEQVATSREWKYSTTSGAPYSSFGTPETGTTYTPNFSVDATYYVVCQSLINGNTVTSNEVQVVVTTVSANSNSIAPTEIQYLEVNQNGPVLTVSETPATADNREWKFSTTSGSGYGSFTTPQTATTYTPNFSAQGIYYVVCESNFGGTIVTSNEVKIIVDTDVSDYYLEFDGDDSFFVNDNANNDLDVTTDYTYETWVKVDEYNDGDYSRIMYRNNLFSLHLINDNEDDFAISFKSYVGTAPSISSENSVLSNLKINEWFHVAVTRDGTDTKLFINGIKIAESSDADFALSSSTTALNIGAKYSGSYSNYLKGFVENVQVSNIARYSANFIPDFYSSQHADANSVLCLNLENNGGTNLFDASGNFTNVSLRAANNDAEWKLKAENSISPIATQNIYQNADGTELTVSENGLASNTEWKYATTSGGAYSSFATPETNKTYTPNFASIGTYYVVCVSNFNGTEVTSNEVQINVSASASISTSAISGSPFYVTASTGISVNVDYTITGTFDVGNTFTAYLSDASGDFTNETAIGTLVTETVGTINATIPANTATGNGYRIRVKSDTPMAVGSDNGSNLIITLLENSIAPINTQNVAVNADGTELTVTESIAATSREWKYSTTSGSGYVSFGTPETATSYTPNFSTQGIYYVVCESNFSGTILTSNEVIIVVDTDISDYYLEFDGDDRFYVKDDNQDFINLTNNYTFETWVKVAERADGTYPVIMDRDKCFSMFVQADNTDDYSIAFVTRDVNNNVVSSLSSANLATVDFNFNQWYHVAVQYDGTTAKMFINGNEIVTSNNNFTLRVPTSDYINFAVRYRSNYERYLNGSLENIHISNIARYTSNFTPNFYIQQLADENSIICLNLENNTGTNLFDATGHFNNVTLAGSSHLASWKLKAENSVTPWDSQNILEGANGTELTVLENGLASSTEWKYATTSGGTYSSFTTAETNKTYTPNFANEGTYYVVCVSNFNGTEITSNEVQINVTVEPAITTGTISGSPFAVTNLAGANVNVPFTIEGIFDAANNFKAYLSDASGSFASEVEIGTLSSATAGTITAEIPANTPSGTAYRIRVKSDNPIVVGSDNGVNLVVDFTSGVNDIASSKIKIYPNPASDILYIGTDNQIEAIQIFDNLGKLVFEKNITTKSINISNLNSGIFTIVIKTKNGLNRSQFIKK